MSTGCHWSTLGHSPVPAACHRHSAAARNLLHLGHPPRPCEESSFPHQVNGACKRREKLQLFWAISAVERVSTSSLTSCVFSPGKRPHSLSSLLHKEARACSPVLARVWPVPLSRSRFPSHLKRVKMSLRCSMVTTPCESRTKEFVRCFSTCRTHLPVIGWCPSQESLGLWCMRQQAACRCCILLSPCLIHPQNCKGSSKFCSLGQASWVCPGIMSATAWRKLWKAQCVHHRPSPQVPVQTQSPFPAFAVDPSPAQLGTSAYFSGASQGHCPPHYLSESQVSGVPQQIPVVRQDPPVLCQGLALLWQKNMDILKPQFPLFINTFNYYTITHNPFIFCWSRCYMIPWKMLILRYYRRSWCVLTTEHIIRGLNFNYGFLCSAIHQL